MPVVQFFKLKWISILLLSLFCFFSNSAMAQSKDGAFDTITFSLSYQKNTNRNIFHSFWLPDPAFQVELETPFYAGDFFLGGRFTTFANKENGLPDIHYIQANVGWGLNIPVTRRFSINAKTAILFSMMRFTNVSAEHQERAEKRFGSTSPESEIGFLLGTDITYHINEKWGVKLQWNRNVIYTREKLKLNYFGLGISRKLTTPSWLKGILQ